MAVESTFYSAVTGNGAIAALVSDRVYPAVAPPSRTYPLIVYSTISGVPDASDGCELVRIQADIYASTYSSVKAIRDAVQALAEATGNWTYVEGPDDYEDEEEVFRQIVDLIIMTEV